MKNKWLKNSNRQHLRYSMRQASGIALALVMGISVAAAGHTQSVKAAVDTQTADTGVTATTDTANQTTETTIKECRHKKYRCRYYKRDSSISPE